MIYNTSTVSDVTPGYYFWNATKSIWMRVLDSDSYGWSLNGNSGLSSVTNFIGTIDDVDVVFKRRNVHAGLLSAHHSFNTSFGFHSYKGSPQGTLQGIRNTAIGSSSLHGNSLGIVIGSDNTAVGANSLLVNYEGQENVAVGSDALKSNTGGSNNTAIGFSSLKANTSGRNNIANGAFALTQNMEGVANIAIGSWALSSNINGNYNIAVGTEALIRNATGIYNTAIGNNASLNNVVGSFNTAIGHEALSNNTTGSNNVAVGVQSGPSTSNLKNTVAIGFRSIVNESNTIQLGNPDITKLSAPIGLAVSSDQRYKQNVRTIALGLDFINRLHPVEYIGKNNESKTKEWGIIAQELQETLRDVDYKDAGIVQEDGSDNRILFIRYMDLIAPIIKAMQELTDQNKKLKERIEILESN